MSVQRTPKDWMLLLALVAMWGSSFMFNRIAVATLPPWTVVAGRIGIAALVLTVIVYALGRRLPPPGRAWLPFAVIAMIGNALPFYLITWGQQVVESALAGILMAVMPLATIVLAHFLIAGEHLTRQRAAGFAVGFLGIVLLMGPAALAGIGGEAVRIISQLAVLGGALCYALQSVLTRLIVKGDVIVAAAGTLLLASSVVIPVALWLDRPWLLVPSTASAAAVVWLGVGPTAVATILYFMLIRSAGPSFMSLVNYLSPGVAVMLGLLVMGETPSANAYFGLALILAGIAVTQWWRAARTP
ncbi:MAG: DMT family transporter [Burkholderiales bacterium]|nr:DMT family transporter [Burkholderiales bacterium]MDP2397071.1 DMT family transporter [Burkholderiales bacterium]